LQQELKTWTIPGSVLQLTQKKTTLQFKALDQTLQTINRETNQKESLTYRCADMDKLVPSLMGVSKVQADRRA
jgi:membrane-bound inhibitor of C-type lysozyme